MLLPPAGQSAFYSTPLPPDFELGRSFRPCARCRTFDIPFIPALSLITVQPFAYDAARSVAGRTRLCLFSPFFPALLSFPRRVHCLPFYLGLNLEISKPSPGERQATVAQRFPPISVSVCWATAARFLALFTTRYRPSDTPFIIAEAYPLAAARITTRTYRPRSTPWCVLVPEAQLGFISVSSLSNSRADNPSAI